MTINCYRITGDSQLTPFDYDSAIDETKKEDSIVWIDVQGFEKEKLEKVLEDLGISSIAKQLCLENNNKQGFYPLKELTFLVFPVITGLGDLHGVEHVVLLLRENFLLTLRDVRATQLQKTLSFQDSSEWLPGKNVQALVTVYLTVLSLESLHRIEELRNSIMNLEKQMDRDAASVSIEDISHKRTELLTFESVVSGQLPVIEALINSGKDKLKEGKIQEYLLYANANLQSSKNALEWLEGRIDVLRIEFETRAQDRTNRKLGKLTIISSVFLPITFLAGIWGMNFENMPLLNYPMGFLVAIGIMLLISLGSYFFFRSKKME